MIFCQSKQIYDQVMRGLVNPAAFDLVILYDLTLFTDKQWLYMIKYYMLRLPGVGAMISMFSQHPKDCEAAIPLQNWMEGKVVELRSKFIELADIKYAVNVVPWAGEKLLSSDLDMSVLDQENECLTSLTSILVVVNASSS